MDAAQPGTDASTRVRDGNQTLARGLTVLLAIADGRTPVSVQQVGGLLGVHRSIAYRLLQTLVAHRLVARTNDGLYAPGARLATLAGAYLPTLRDMARPVMRTLADDLQSTISLFVELGDEAVAISIVEPTTATHHLAFRAGMRTPLTRGAAGYAILASDAEQAGEPPQVATARRDGYSFSHAEIEDDQFAVAAWIPFDSSGTRACLNLITYRRDIADAAGPVMRRAADELGELLRLQG